MADRRDRSPVTVHDFMARAVAAYYARGTAFGRKGDFTTAPEISQVFGELIGLWAADLWSRMGAPDPVILAEAGPGRGTLMADALRATEHVMPDFARAAHLHLVETSAALKRRQRRALQGRRVAWHARIEDLPPGPMILIANEFIDALPIRQLVRTADGWRERMVAVDGADPRFVLGPAADPSVLDPAVRDTAREGAVAEVCPEGRAIARRLAARFAAQSGAALLIDYGPPVPGVGDSLQAVKRHAYAPVLERPGEADLTAHVDFTALAEAARMAGADCLGPIDQGLFLKRIGIDQRARTLLAGAAPEQAAGLVSACNRLIDVQQMGRLFQVLCIATPKMAVPAGFGPDPGSTTDPGPTTESPSRA